MEYQRNGCRKCLTMAVLQFLPHRKSLFFHLLSHPSPDLHLPDQVHLHQHSELISEVNPYLCTSSVVYEMWQRKGEVTGSLGVWKGGNSWEGGFGLLKVSSHESIIYLTTGHTCTHMSQLALTYVVQALWHYRKTDLTLRVSYYTPFQRTRCSHSQHCTS